MFDTPITVVGNVLTAPQWRRTTTTGTFVVTFRVASTSRRYDRARDAWVDGDSLRVRVTCWRRLGENVSVSLQLGDPVIVVGRMYTRDWTDDQGARHTAYEVDAVAVGHDLSRGVDKFARRRPAPGTGTVDSPTSAALVGGELTEAVPDPGRPDDLPPDHELFDAFDPLLYDAAPAGTVSRAAAGAATAGAGGSDAPGGSDDDPYDPGTGGAPDPEADPAVPAGSGLDQCGVDSGLSDVELPDHGERRAEVVAHPARSRRARSTGAAPVPA